MNPPDPGRRCGVWVHGSILLLDNRRMGAISALQEVQYGSAYTTTDEVVWTTSDGHVPCKEFSL
ncbi:MAG: hypothetical protein ABSA52_14815 [Candidatus Binatia bacterium]